MNEFCKYAIHKDNFMRKRQKKSRENALQNVKIYKTVFSWYFGDDD